MKFNWGTGIAIGMLAFMAFILQYVIRVQVNKDYDNELVTENYYQEEVYVDSNHQATVNANELKEKFSIESNDEGVIITFPDTMEPSKIKGAISLYRPSDKSLDQTLDIQLSSSNHLLIPLHQLADGRWDIKVFFTYQGKKYLKKETISIKK